MARFDTILSNLAGLDGIRFIRSSKEIFLKVKCNEILIDLDKSEVHKYNGIEFVPI